MNAPLHTDARRRTRGAMACSQRCTLTSEAVGATSIAATGARLAEWLSDHGVAARVERYEWKAGGGNQWLLSRAADLGSDLIVMGGYGHARMREIVLGGMTRTILREMTVPVLMSH